MNGQKDSILTFKQLERKLILHYLRPLNNITLYLNWYFINFVKKYNID